MSKISVYLDKILSSVYGKDVRQAIHDSIKCCYDDVTAGVSLANTAATAANTAADNSETRTSEAILSLTTDVNTAVANAANATTSANNAASNAENKASAAQTAANDANAAKEACNEVVAELPNTIENYFASLGLCVVDGKLCVEVQRNE